MAPDLMDPKQADQCGALRKNNNSLIQVPLKVFTALEPMSSCEVRLLVQNLGCAETLPINPPHLGCLSFSCHGNEGLTPEDFSLSGSVCASRVHIRKNVALLWHPDYFELVALKKKE